MEDKKEKAAANINMSFGLKIIITDLGCSVYQEREDY